MMIVFTIFAVAIFDLASGQAICPPGDDDLSYLTAYQVDDAVTKFYFLVRRRRSFFQCHNHCRNRMFNGQKMDLLSFGSKAEQDWVGNSLSNGTCAVIRNYILWTSLNSLDNLLTNTPQNLPTNAWTWLATGEPLSYPTLISGNRENLTVFEIRMGYNTNPAEV